MAGHSHGAWNPRDEQRQPHRKAPLEPCREIPQSFDWRLPANILTTVQAPILGLSRYPLEPIPDPQPVSADRGHPSDAIPCPLPVGTQNGALLILHPPIISGLSTLGPHTVPYHRERVTYPRDVDSTFRAPGDLWVSCPPPEEGMPHPVQVDRETCSHLLLGKELQVIWVPDVPLSHSLILASRRQRGAPDHRLCV